jgi:Cu(I)-responsive transcriptional regulator
MNIGEAAVQAGLSAKRVRHYEAIGLIPKASRTFGNYRAYSDHDVHTLRFIRHARSLGFSIEAIRALLALWRDRRRPSRKVKELVLAHIGELDRRIEDLRRMKATLEHLAGHCHGDDRPECPILEELAGTSPKSGDRRPDLR